MLIGVDVDDVLAELMEQLLRDYNLEHGTGISKNDVLSYDLSELWGGTIEETIAIVNGFYHGSLFREIQPVFGSQEGVRKLSERHKLEVITSRPYSIERETKGWVEEYFGGLFSEVTLTNEFPLDERPGRGKHEVCEERGIDVLIDDYMGHAERCSGNGTRVLLYDQPWNQGEVPEGVTRVYSWNDVVREIDGPDGI
tara:strand:+ start:1926 stop:2516 length:591 start_codon:yes stop_codon:yes gene_type:complete